MYNMHNKSSNKYQRDLLLFHCEPTNRSRALDKARR